jgi:adenosylcobinamide-GDP ribazoletransferase
VNASALRSALAFLTVLPVAARDGAPGERLGRALFPAVGLLLGLAAWGALWLGTLAAGPLFGAVAALAALALLTGGLHLDGLADCADGLLASGGRERRLEIMRDPRLGAFAVTALVLVLLADVALLQRLGVRAALPALVAAGAFSRLAMLAVLVALPYARERGLGRAAAGRGPLDLAVGAVLTAPAFLLDWRHAAVGLVGAAAAAGIVGALAYRRIGGATGDVYGAVSEMGQLGVLLAFLLPL